MVYGSANGGKHIYDADPLIAEKLKQAAIKLNLRGHLDKHGEHTLHAATDLEGHVGYDGRRYLLDFSRAMPPEYPRKAYEFFRIFSEFLVIY